MIRKGTGRATRDITTGSAPLLETAQSVTELVQKDAAHPRLTAYDLDLRDYLPDVADIDATEEQKLELLLVLLSIMRSCVELGFSAERTNQVLSAINTESATRPDSRTGVAAQEEAGFDAKPKEGVE